jgi:hypothetical protein
MTERYLTPHRNDRLDPHRWEIDLKWSAWTTDESIWEERAPDTYSMLKDGFEGGSFEEYREPMIIRSYPRKEGLYMVVTLTPGREGVHVHVFAAATWDDIHDLLDTLELEDQQLEELRSRLYDDGLIDYRLDGDPGVVIEREFVISPSDQDGKDELASFMQQVNAVEDDLLQRSRHEWDQLKVWAALERRQYSPPSPHRRPRGARRPNQEYMRKLTRAERARLQQINTEIQRCKDQIDDAFQRFAFQARALPPSLAVREAYNLRRELEQEKAALIRAARERQAR